MHVRTKIQFYPKLRFFLLPKLGGNILKLINLLDKRKWFQYYHQFSAKQAALSSTKKLLALTLLNWSVLVMWGREGGG